MGGINPFNVLRIYRESLPQLNDSEKTQALRQQAGEYLADSVVLATLAGASFLTSERDMHTLHGFGSTALTIGSMVASATYLVAASVTAENAHASEPNPALCPYQGWW